MTKIAQDYVADFFGRSVVALQNASEDRNLHVCILQIADLIGRALQNGNKLLIAGNGGSAADAQHLAGEFLSRYQHDRRPLPAIALTTDTSVLTAIGNDYGFEFYLRASGARTWPRRRRVSSHFDLGSFRQCVSSIASRARQGIENGRLFRCQWRRDARVLRFPACGALR